MSNYYHGALAHFSTYNYYFYCIVLLNFVHINFYLPGQLGAGAIAEITSAVVATCGVNRHLKKVAMIINNN